MNVDIGWIISAAPRPNCWEGIICLTRYLFRLGEVGATALTYSAVPHHLTRP